MHLALNAAHCLVHCSFRDLLAIETVMEVDCLIRLKMRCGLYGQFLIRTCNRWNRHFLRDQTETRDPDIRGFQTAATTRCDKHINATGWIRGKKSRITHIVAALELLLGAALLRNSRDLRVRILAGRAELWNGDRLGKINNYDLSIRTAMRDRMHAGVQTNQRSKIKN